jgi:tRNA threonylcarbamoyladenosine biosynthesis protein TsaE
MVTPGLRQPADPGLRIETSSAAQTRDLAAHLAKVAQPGDRIALLGPLGAGKTQFAKGFAVGLGIDDVVTSPSFTLMAEYEGRLTLFHQDLFRLDGAAAVLGGGLLDERQDSGVTLSEWADRLDAELDPERLTVTLEPTGATTRIVHVRGHGAPAERYTGAARAWAATVGGSRTRLSGEATGAASPGSVSQPGLTTEGGLR